MRADDDHVDVVVVSCGDDRIGWIPNLPDHLGLVETGALTPSDTSGCRRPSAGMQTGGTTRRLVGVPRAQSLS